MYHHDCKDDNRHGCHHVLSRTSDRRLAGLLALAETTEAVAISS